MFAVISKKPNKFANDMDILSRGDPALIVTEVMTVKVQKRYKKT